MMKVVFLALLAQAAAKDTPAKVGCVEACKPPSPVDSHCVTDCQQDMYQCIDETGPNENEENTKACQDKVIKKYEEHNKEPKKEEEKKEEKKESAAFLQRDFAKLHKLEDDPEEKDGGEWDTEFPESEGEEALGVPDTPAEEHADEPTEEEAETETSEEETEEEHHEEEPAEEHHEEEHHEEEAAEEHEEEPKEEENKEEATEEDEAAVEEEDKEEEKKEEAKEEQEEEKEEATEEDEGHDEEKKEEKKESAAFLQRDFDKLDKIEGSYAKIESDSLSHHEAYHKSTVKFVQRDFSKIEKIAGQSLEQLHSDELSHKSHKVSFAHLDFSKMRNIAFRGLAKIEARAGH